MKIIRNFKNQDGINRKWIYDSEKNFIYYEGLAKYLQNNFIINTNNQTAQELIDELNRFKM
jgi:hypothetical protein